MSRRFIFNSMKQEPLAAGASLWTWAALLTRALCRQSSSWVCEHLSVGPAVLCVVLHVLLFVPSPAFSRPHPVGAAESGQ